MPNTLTKDQIISATYVALFTRAPDQAGLNHWRAEAATVEAAGKTGMDLAKSMAVQFALHPAFTTLYGSMGDAAFIDAIYMNIGGKVADTQGRTHWLSKLTDAAHPITRAELVGEFIYGVLSITPAEINALTITAAEKIDGIARQDRLNHKATVALEFTAAMGVGSNLAAGTDSNSLASLAKDPAYLGSQAIIAGVTEDSATMTAPSTYLKGTPTLDGIVATFSGGTVSAGQTFTLTPGADTFPGTTGADVIRGVAGVAVGGQDQTTLNSSDVLDGGAGTADLLVVNMTGPAYNGGATIKNIETLQIGTNLAAATFDYNVNNGAYEVTGVNTVVYDQITTGEVLTVNNVTPSATGSVVPTFSWENESGSRAGTIGATYRQASTAGTADNQTVVLKNVNAMNAGDGILNIAGGIETITLKSTGAVTNNTLNNSGNADTGNNAVAADVISAGTLTKVVLTGDVANGKAAGVVTDTTGARAAFIGQTDRVAGGDMGLTADATANATESNLLSVGARVTEVDASAATAAVNVRFVAKADASATNVTFKGGLVNDYVEFENGNINANGGTGDDTFAFINAQANGTFGEGDTIDGGAGADTIQIGLNGNAQTYNISETELRNKSSIGTLDLRGLTTNLTLSSDFVAKADTADSIAIRTDKIIQSSATSAINPTAGANNALENASTHTVNLTKLTSNQSVNYTGGSGSDRIILSDATYNVQKTLVGGGNEGQAIAAGVGRYDTITLVTNGENVVIDAQDLSTTSGFEGFVLTKNGAAATYNITLTQAFLNANTLAADDATTGIVETNFQIGTAAAANNSALAAGDTVTIDVRNLLNAGDTGRAAGFATRTFDVTSLENAGATVTFIGNTGNLTLAQVRLAGVAVANGASANAADVTATSAAIPSTTPVAYYTGGAADETVTLVAPTNSVDMGAGNDTVTLPAALLATGTLAGGAGAADTLVLGAGATIDGATVSGFEAFTLAGAASMTAAQYNAFTTGANAGSGADVLTITNAGTITGDADIETITFGLAGSTNQITLAGITAQAINGNTGADTVVSSIANSANKTITLGTGADVLTISDAVAANWSFTAAGVAGALVTGVETVNLQAGINTGATVTMFNGAATVNLTTGLVALQNGGGITLGTGGQTVAITGGSTGVYTITANTGADSLNLTAPGGAVTFVAAPANSLVTAFDTITGFRAGTDRIDTTTAVGANEFTARTIATADVAGLAAALTNAVAEAQTAAAANWSANGDTVVVTVSAGTAAGTYIVHNEGAGNGGFIAAEDLVVKMVGVVGVLTAADII